VRNPIFSQRGRSLTLHNKRLSSGPRFSSPFFQTKPFLSRLPSLPRAPTTQQNFSPSLPQTLLEFSTYKDFFRASSFFRKPVNDFSRSTAPPPVQKIRITQNNRLFRSSPNQPSTLTSKRPPGDSAPCSSYDLAHPAISPPNTAPSGPHLSPTDRGAPSLHPFSQLPPCLHAFSASQDHFRHQSSGDSFPQENHHFRWPKITLPPFSLLGMSVLSRSALLSVFAVYLGTGQERVMARASLALCLSSPRRRTPFRI